MANSDDNLISVADEYAEAALALAEEQAASDRFLAELGEVVALLRTDRDLAQFMDSPVVDKDRRKEVLERALRGRVSDLVLNTILVLNEKSRAGLVPLVHERFRLALERKRNEVDVHVTTAVPLSDAQRKRLDETVRGYTGRIPRLVEKVDAGVIAGLRLQIEDDLLDDTAAHHLHNMRARLLERASMELHKG